MSSQKYQLDCFNVVLVYKASSSRHELNCFLCELCWILGDLKTIKTRVSSFSVGWWCVVPRCQISDQSLYLPGRDATTNIILKYKKELQPVQSTIYWGRFAPYEQQIFTKAQ